MLPQGQLLLQTSGRSGYRVFKQFHDLAPPLFQTDYDIDYHYHYKEKLRGGLDRNKEFTDLMNVEWLTAVRDAISGKTAGLAADGLQ
jgi:hypothetical protein